MSNSATENGSTGNGVTGYAANGHAARNGSNGNGAFPWGDAEWFKNLDRTEERCRKYLEGLRWPEGVSCPRCSSSDTARLETRKKFYCRTCRYHFSVTSGTLMHSSHLPVWKWFLTISMMSQAEDGLPANQLVRLLGVTYKTAWFVEHRVRAALQDGRQLTVPAVVAPQGRRQRVFDRPITGRYHQLDVKYLDAYLAEIEWRADARLNPNAFRETVLRLLTSEPLGYDDLTSRAGGATASRMAKETTQAV